MSLRNLGEIAKHKWAYRPTSQAAEGRLNKMLYISTSRSISYGHQLHVQAGKAWIWDSSRTHTRASTAGQSRETFIHLQTPFH